MQLSAYNIRSHCSCYPTVHVSNTCSPQDRTFVVFMLKGKSHRNWEDPKLCILPSFHFLSTFSVIG